MNTNTESTEQGASRTCSHQWQTADDGNTHYCNGDYGAHVSGLHVCDCTATAPYFAESADDRGETFDPPTPVETAASLRLRERIADALRRIAAVIAVLADTTITALSEDERALWDSTLQEIDARRSTATDYAARTGEQVEWRASDCEHYAHCSERDLTNLAQMVHDANARRDDMTAMPIGTMPNEQGAEWQYAAQRGAAFVARSRWSTIADCRTALPDTTISDLLTYWAARRAAYIADVDTVNRTLRAEDRVRRYNVHEDVVTELWDADALHSNRWHAAQQSRRTLALSADDVNAERCAVIAPVPQVRDLHDACTVADVVHAIRELETQHRSDLETMGETLLHEATDGRGSSWCGEYEQVMERLNSELSEYICDEPFKARGYEYCVDGHAVLTLRINVGWSETVRARSADDAMQQVDAYAQEVDVHDALCSEWGISYEQARSILRGCNWDLDDYETDDANRCD